MIRRLNTLSSKDTAANRLVATNTLSAQANPLSLSGFSLAPDQTKRYLLRVQLEITVEVAVVINFNGSNMPGTYIVSRTNAALSGSGSASISFLSSTGVAANTKCFAEMILQYIEGIGWVGLLESVSFTGSIPIRHINTFFFSSTAALTSINCTMTGSNFKAGSKLELFDYNGALG